MLTWLTGVALAIALAGSGPAQSTGPKAAGYENYTAVLSRFVDGDGLVDYAGLKAGRAPLDSFVASVERLNRGVYESWEKPDRLAFLLNAYNALTLRLIIDNYPITPQTSRTSYPPNSIRQIPGSWDNRKFVVMGEPVSLNQIEHDMIRREFPEPRIHMALVCAAKSCPRLRGEPYGGDVLDAQLADQTRAFLADLRNLHVDREKNEVWTSEIFKWYAEDFVPDVFKTSNRPDGEKKALVSVAEYAPEGVREYLRSATYRVDYFGYDWSLNEQVK